MELILALILALVHLTAVLFALFFNYQALLIARGREDVFTHIDREMQQLRESERRWRTPQ